VRQVGYLLELHISNETGLSDGVRK
jgi:hypothetical protein